jgi:hypothetical protein
MSSVYQQLNLFETAHTMPIPPLVFIIGLILALLLYTSSLFVYFRRRKLFPIQQRYPHLVIVELSVFALNSVAFSIHAAAPNSAFFSSCYDYNVLLALLEHVPVAVTIYRLVLVFFKDLDTKLLMLEEKFLLTHGKIPALSAPVVKNHSVGNPFFKVSLWILKQFIKKNFSLSQISLIFISPVILLGTVDLIQLSSTIQSKNFSSSEVDCINSIYTSTVIKMTLFSYYSVLAVIGFFSFLKMEDNFSLGKEIRGLLCICVAVALVLMTELNGDLFIFMQVQTRLFEFLFGLVIIPVLFCLQTIRPIMLSVLHEKEEKEFQEKEPFENAPSGSAPVRKSTAAQRMAVLKGLIEDQEARNHLLKFLELEFSVENLFFVEHCILFKNKCTQYAGSPRSSQVVELVKLIHLIGDTFICESSVSSVNVSSRTRQGMIEALRKVKVVIPITEDEKMADRPVQTNTSARTLLGSSPLMSQRESTDRSSRSRQEKEYQVLSVSKETLLDASIWAVQDLEELGIDPDMFEKGKEEILQLIVSDSFLRFRVKEDAIYRRFRQKVVEQKI